MSTPPASDDRPSLADQLKLLVCERTTLLARVGAIDADLDAIRVVVRDLAQLAPAPDAEVFRAHDHGDVQAGDLVHRGGGRAPTRSDVEFRRYVQLHPGSSAGEIADGLVATRSVTKRKLALLQKAGLLHVVGRTTGAKWFHGPKPPAEPDVIQETVWHGEKDKSLSGKQPIGSGSTLSPAAFQRAGH